MAEGDIFIMTTTLIAYRVTQHLGEWFVETLRLQREACTSWWDAVVVGDCVFQEEVPTLVVEGAVQPEGLCLARLSNAALDYAQERGYECLILLDGDFAIVNRVETIPPVGVLIAHKQKQNGSLFPEEPEYEPSAQFVLRKEVIKQVRFCEEFVGYGFEDHDFNYNVLQPRGFFQEDSGIRAVHRWHPVRHELNPMGKRNRGIFERRLHEQIRKTGFIPEKFRGRDGSLDLSKVLAL